MELGVEKQNFIKVARFTEGSVLVKSVRNPFLVEVLGVHIYARLTLWEVREAGLKNDNGHATQKKMYYSTQ